MSLFSRGCFICLYFIKWFIYNSLRFKKVHCSMFKKVQKCLPRWIFVFIFTPLFNGIILRGELFYVHCFIASLFHCYAVATIEQFNNLLNLVFSILSIFFQSQPLTLTLTLNIIILLRVKFICRGCFIKLNIYLIIK